MFDNLSYIEKGLIFQALLCLIESGNGTRFHNNDRRHPIYAEGAKGITSKISKNQDNPEKNTLFKMLSTLSRDFKDNTDFTIMKWWYDFSEWQAFCKFVIRERT